MEIVAEERRLDVFTELARGLVSTQRNRADTVALGCMPLAVIPGPRDHEVVVAGIALFRVAEDLPRPPGVFLVPEPGHIEIRHRRGVKLLDPGLLLPELIVVRMGNDVVP